MSIISEVKQKLDLVEIVSEYVSLQKTGRNFRGLCPFHAERHPSFFVFPDQQTWHCFGACGTGGDVFSFIMKKEGVDFGQALRSLAQRAGIPLGYPNDQAKPEDEERERLFQINELVAEYYHHLLLATKAGEAARNYLAKRKVSLETIREFRLGFSPDAWETLKNYLRSKGYQDKELIEAGLLVEKEDGGTYDRFRNRLMFPICNVQGKVIGFGARALDDSLPKYINSPQTAIFDKSCSLYGIDKARSAIRKTNSVIIVEGYMDVLIAHQQGWRNVIASMGTSLTEKQVDVIKGFTKNVFLALDADTAGEEATLRGQALLAHSGAEAKVLLLPAGKDPDEIISEDPSLWQKLVEQALPILDFAFQSVLSKVDINSAKDKSLAVQKLLPCLSNIRDPIQKAHYLRKLAYELGVEESAVRAVLLEESRKFARRSAPSKPAPKSHLALRLASSPVEEYCLALLLQYPELFSLAQELTAEHFECTENREIFNNWQRFRNMVDLEKNLDSSLLEHLYYLSNKALPPAVRESQRIREADLRSCVLRLQERFSRKLEVVKQMILESEREKGGVSAELSKLEEQGIETGKRLHEIFLKKEKGWIQLKEKTSI